MKNSNSGTKKFAISFMMIVLVLSIFSTPNPVHAVDFPDLIITAVTLSPAAPEAGEPFFVAVTIKNNGLAPMGIGDHVYADVYVDDYSVNSSFCDDGSQYFSDEDTQLAAGEEITTLIPISGLSAGLHTFWAHVDVNCSVEESDESNNVNDPPLQKTFFDSKTTIKSTGSQDGWILETTETGNVGGIKDNTASTFILGDSAKKQQYLSILSFNTSGLDDNAVITSVILRVKRHSVTAGGNPLNKLQGFMADVKFGSFGSSALVLGDFNAPSSKTIGPSVPVLTGGWYNINLTAARTKINKTGITQIRLRFKLDDNNDVIANYIRFFSGDGGAAKQPQLVIKYYVPGP